MDQAQKLFDRLRETEKIELRGATPGALERLADSYRSDMPGLSFEERAQVLATVKKLCHEQFAQISAHPAFGVTWKF